MKTRITITAFAMFTLSGLASAQPFEATVCGLLHTRVGEATLGAPTDRRLPVRNLGSSGQDGVEVQLRSLFGGGVSVDVGPLYAVADGEIKIKIRGWDGTIKGTLRLQSPAGGPVTGGINFAPIGAAGIRWRALDSSGNPIAEGEVDGPSMTWGMPGDPDPLNPPVMDVSARTAGEHFKEVKLVCRREGQPITGLPVGDLEGVAAFGFEPIPCAGCTNSFTDVGSIEVTGRGMDELVVQDSSIGTFSSGVIENGHYAYGISGGASAGRPRLRGLGGAIIGEECDGPAPCTINERRLPIRNLGSSGQDGVEIDLGPNASGVQMTAQRERCCRGHVTLLKAFDDSEQELSRAMETSPPGGGLQLQVDSAAIGATETFVRFYDADGNETGLLVYPGAIAVLDVSALCPPGSIWTKKFINGHWHWYCHSYMDFQVPGGTVISAAGVSIGTDSSLKPRTITMTSNDQGGEMLIDDLAVLSPPAPPSCDPDVNCDGSPDQGDVACMVLAVAGEMSCFCQGDADFNLDGSADQGDLAALIQVVAGMPCP